MRTVLSALLVAVGVSAIQVNHAPLATSYIYRNDNNGPASLIQVGGHGYQQPLAFAPPLPLAQPLKALEAYDLAPAPLPYVAAKPIVIEDAEEDDEDSDDDTDEYLHSGNGDETGGGSDYEEEYHKAHGESGKKGHHNKGHHASGVAGSYGKGHKEGYYSEANGEKGAHHDELDTHGKHHEAGENYKGGDHGHKSHFSKGEKITGYHKVYNKDEFKKDHDFYDVEDNKGNYNKHGYEKEKHGSAKGGHKEGQHSDSDFNKGGFGKSGYHSKGHVDEADAGQSIEEGNESHYNNHKDYGNKGASAHGKEYEYDDDDEDDDHEGH